MGLVIALRLGILIYIEHLCSHGSQIQSPCACRSLPCHPACSQQCIKRVDCVPLPAIHLLAHGANEGLVGAGCGVVFTGQVYSCTLNTIRKELFFDIPCWSPLYGVSEDATCSLEGTGQRSQLTFPIVFSSRLTGCTY